MTVIEGVPGVPRFEREEYREKESNYCVLIPIINEEEEKHHKAKKKKRRKSDYTASRYESDFQTATDDLEDVDDIAVPAGKNQTTGKEEA